MAETYNLPPGQYTADRCIALSVDIERRNKNIHALTCSIPHTWMYVLEHRCNEAANTINGVNNQ